jgi:hypothetical protein
MIRRLASGSKRLPAGLGQTGGETPARHHTTLERKKADGQHYYITTCRVAQALYAFRFTDWRPPEESVSGNKKLPARACSDRRGAAHRCFYGGTSMSNSILHQKPEERKPSSLLSFHPPKQHRTPSRGCSTKGQRTTLPLTHFLPPRPRSTRAIRTLSSSVTVEPSLVFGVAAGATGP